MSIATRTLTAFERIAGTISGPARGGLVSFGSRGANKFMRDLLGILESNTSGRGTDLLGVPHPIGVEATFDLDGAGGGAGYSGGARIRIPLHFTDKVRTAVRATLAISQEDAALDVVGSAWVRFGYTLNGYVAVTYITAIAQVTAAVTEYAITTAAIPDNALLFAEISLGAGERLAGLANVSIR